MKVLIIGIVASGKTTLARRLSKETNIKNYEIDLIVHDDKNKRKRTNKEQQKIIEKINKQSDWIIEGTLRKNLYNLLELADKIIYLDIPIQVRKRRILLRYIKQKLKIEKSNYRPNKEMLKNMYKWTNEFENNKIELEEEILKYKEKLIVLKSKRKIKLYKLNLV
ncbi:MAG: AAA family ATPase [Clostridia bacterium]|jgi:hypothetical protein